MVVDTGNLSTASLYINNQLLSRGLLRDGQTIDFAGEDDSEYDEATRGKIIRIVNDLILRRDVSSSREALSMTEEELTIVCSAMPNIASLCRQRCALCVPTT